MFDCGKDTKSTVNESAHKLYTAIVKELHDQLLNTTICEPNGKKHKRSSGQKWLPDNKKNEFDIAKDYG